MIAIIQVTIGHGIHSICKVSNLLRSSYSRRSVPKAPELSD